MKGKRAVVISRRIKVVGLMGVWGVGLKCMVRVLCGDVFG